MIESLKPAREVHWFRWWAVMDTAKIQNKQYEVIGVTAQRK